MIYLFFLSIIPTIQLSERAEITGVSPPPPPLVLAFTLFSAEDSAFPLLVGFHWSLLTHALKLKLSTAAIKRHIKYAFCFFGNPPVFEPRPSYASDDDF